MPLEVVDVCDDDGVSGESLIGKAGASRLFLFLVHPLNTGGTEFYNTPDTNPSFAINSRSRLAGLKVSSRIPLRFFQVNLAQHLTHTALSLDVSTFRPRSLRHFGSAHFDTAQCNAIRRSAHFDPAVQRSAAQNIAPLTSTPLSAARYGVSRLRNLG